MRSDGWSPSPALEALSPPLLLLDEPSRDFDENWMSVFESWLEKVPSARHERHSNQS